MKVAQFDTRIKSRMVLASNYFNTDEQSQAGGVCAMHQIKSVVVL